MPCKWHDFIPTTVETIDDDNFSYTLTKLSSKRATAGSTLTTCYSSAPRQWCHSISNILWMKRYGGGWGEAGMSPQGGCQKEKQVPRHAGWGHGAHSGGHRHVQRHRGNTGKDEPSKVSDGEWGTWPLSQHLRIKTLEEPALPFFFLRKML